METSGKSEIAAPSAGPVTPAPWAKRFFARARQLHARDVQLYRACDDLTEPLIYFMVVFSPWAFGTTQPWSIWLMNAAGYLLGLLLAGKLAIRWLKGYRPARWDGGKTARLRDCGTTGLRDYETTGPLDHETTGLRDYETTGLRDYGTTGLRDYGTTRPGDCGTTGLRDQEAASEVRGPRSVVSSQWSVVRGLLSMVRDPWSIVTTRHRLVSVLAGLTVAILGYCLLSAVNARATFHRDELSFAYHRCIRWLPHSLDSGRSWPAFWTYLGLACSFWALRDWLLGKSQVEERAERRKPQPGGDGSGPLLPARLRRLLWVLAVNGGLLGVEGIAQRLQGSGKLLFLVKPRVNPEAETQFGPYAYRSNAAQYFNLLWPVCLGFWWTLNRSRGVRQDVRQGAHHLLLFFAAIMAACPIISTSRAGAVVAVGIIVLAAFFLAATHFLLSAHRRPDRRARRITTACLVLFFGGALALGFALGWKTLKPRMADLSEGFEVREQMYDFARPMAADYPLFGTGPGTFETVFQLYRITTRHLLAGAIAQ